MKVYTQEEYDAIERDKYGVKHLPQGDYSRVALKGSLNTLGDDNKLGNDNTLGDDNKLGDRNKLGNRNTLGKSCYFGEFFIHGKNTSFEGGAVKNGTFIKVGRIGSEMRDAYFFIDENGKLFVRAGCWFSDMDSFIERVHEVHGGTRHERQYLAACEYAKAVLPEMLEEINNG
jgi:hypothetical protein